MTSKTLYLLLIVFVILAGAYAIPRIFKEEEQSGPLSLATIQDSTVDEFTVRSSEGAVNLVKKDSGWKIGEEEADPEKVASVWPAIENLTIEGPLTSNPANHERFEVTENVGTSVVFKKEGKNIEAFIVGRSGGYNETYFRREGKDEVFRVNQDWDSLFSVKAEDWKKKEIPPANNNTNSAE